MEKLFMSQAIMFKILFKILFKRMLKHLLKNSATISADITEVISHNPVREALRSAALYVNITVATKGIFVIYMMKTEKEWLKV